MLLVLICEFPVDTLRPENERESAGAYRNVINVVDDQMLIFDPQERKQGVKLSISKAQRCGSMTF